MQSLISTERHRVSTAEHTSILASTQSDRARLIYSAAFRRLQQKAQVFSLESNAAVRSRLTHSIEVSHIGRYLVASIQEKILKKEQFMHAEYWKEHSLAISNIVETACLMHDIGNPPFGHFGEAAIVEWANGVEAARKAGCSALGENFEDSLLDDFKYFDGNPQGFRIITKLQGDDGLHGLNLTYTQLAAFLKYTHSPSSIMSGNDDLAFRKKIGYFETEKEVIESAWESLSMPKHMRHPLGFLMEASDDISYCISDIEDGIEKNIISVSHFANQMICQLQKINSEYSGNKICDKLIAKLQGENNGKTGDFLSFKTTLSNFLVETVSEKYIENYESLLSFDFKKELISKGSIEHAILKILKIYTGDYLFTSAEAECMELSGFSIISGILKEYEQLLKLPSKQFLSLMENDFENIKKYGLHRHRRLYNRLPSKHINAYKSAIAKQSVLSKDFEEVFKRKFNEIDVKVEWHLRVHLIVDFISGMTDQFSMEFYQMLKGINVN